MNVVVYDFPVFQNRPRCLGLWSCRPVRGYRLSVRCCVAGLYGELDCLSGVLGSLPEGRGDLFGVLVSVFLRGSGVAVPSATTVSFTGVLSPSSPDIPDRSTCLTL